ncbi:MAG: hypothetical protein AB1Z50_07690 [Desulfuromonadales bacterium]
MSENHVCGIHILEQCLAALTANGFDVFVARDMTCATTGRCHDCNSPQRI